MLKRQTEIKRDGERDMKTRERERERTRAGLTDKTSLHEQQKCI